jgi:hypothetical protein
MIHHKPFHLHVFNSSAFYPIATFWIVASAVAYVLAQQWLGVLGGFLILLLAAVLAVLVATWKELMAYRDRTKLLAEMLDGQRVELLNEIEELRGVLIRHGIPPPPPGPKEQQARDQAEHQHNGGLAT